MSELLAVDLGATSLRTARFDERGEMIGARSRRRTPYPCTPERLVALVAERARRTDVGTVSLGFPGEVVDGVIGDAANLTRPAGLLSPPSAELDRRWRGYELQVELAKATGCETIVLNDAAMAALGAMTGVGTELVITLGAGCGLALAHDGTLVKVRDVGNELLRGSETYDDVLGERGRRGDETAWLQHVVATVDALANEFHADVMHLGGGNARRISPHAFGARAGQIRIARDDVGLRGAFLAAQG